MTSRDFCFWLQGFLEVSDSHDDTKVESLQPEHVACIKKHLALVFVHEIDPSMGKPAHQAVLDHLHGPGTTGTGILRC
jgi:hypothetical protein